MSFRLFIYYCAVCGGWAAFIGWAIGKVLSKTTSDVTKIAGIQGMFLGMFVALGLSVVDSLWNLSLRQFGQIVMRVGTEPLSKTLDFASDCFAKARRSPEAAEGLRAFAEKRPAKWAQ